MSAGKWACFRRTVGVRAPSVAVFITVLFLSILVGGGARGQSAPKRDSSGALTWEATRSARPAPFRSFRDSLETTLKAHKIDLNSKAYHFVVLFNTVRTQGPAPQWMRDILYGLLRYYLTDSDQISFVPYQLHVREKDAVWERSVTGEVAETIYSNVPDQPVQEPGYVGGNDVEGAIEAVLKKIKKPETAILIILTDSEVSHAPDSPVGYTLSIQKPEFNEFFAHSGFQRLLSKPYPFKAEDATGKSIDATGFYRIYAPVSPTPLGEFPAGSTRASISSQPEKPDQVGGNGGGSSGGSSVGNSGGDVPAANTTPFPLGLVLGIAGGLLVVALIGGYIVRLMRVHSLIVGINSDTVAKVSYGKPVYLGAGDSNRMIKLDGFPDDMTSVEKAARLEVNLMGDVQLCSESWKVRNSPVVIRGKHTVPLTRVAGGSTALGSGQTVNIRVEKSR